LCAVESHLAGRVDADGEHDGRPLHVGQQAGGVLGQPWWVQPGAPIGQVDGDAAPPRLGVDAAAGLDEAGDIGDGVRQHHVVTIGGDGERLVEIGAGGRIERDELDVRAIHGPGAVDERVQVAQHRRRHLFGLGQHVGRELTRHREVAPDLLESGTEGGGQVGREALDGQRRAPMNMPLSAS
jgi:hypothetical protein